MTAEDAKAYQVELWLAGDDCRRKLGGVREWSQQIQ